METLDSIKELIKNELEKSSYSLYSLNFKKSKNSVLEVVVDKDEPINLDDIASISNSISELLDKHEFCEEAYCLDVSSLGIEKPIDVKNFKKYLNSYVNVHTTHPFKGLSYLEGTIIEVTDNTIKLQYFVKGKKTVAELELQYIDRAHLAVKF